MAYIKRNINPGEIRCSWDNALRDINNPVYTVYYKNKEIDFIGSLSVVNKAFSFVKNLIYEALKIEQNLVSQNYLLPGVDKWQVYEIKNRLEKKS